MKAFQILHKPILALLVSIIISCNSSNSNKIPQSNYYTTEAGKTEMDKVISEYIIGHSSPIYSPTDKQFEVHKTYGIEYKDSLIYFYIYSLYEGYSFTDGIFKMQSGGSFPVLIVLKEKDKTFEVIKYKEPQDGENYAKSIRDMFPSSYAQQAIEDTGNLPELHEKIKVKAKEWLKLQGKEKSLFSE